MNKIFRLFDLMVEKNINAKKISDDTGISTGNISDWKSGRSKPSIEKLELLADYFDVSVDYLLGREKKSLFSDLSDNEQKIISIFKKLTDTQQGRIIERAEILAEQNKPDIEMSEKTYPVRAVAFGGGNTDTEITEEELQYAEALIHKLKNKEKQ